MSQLWIPLKALKSPFYQQNLDALKMQNPGLGLETEQAVEKENFTVRQTSPALFEARFCDNQGAVTASDSNCFSYQMNYLYPRIQESVQHGSELIALCGIGSGVLFSKILPLFISSSNWQLVILEPNPVWIAFLLQLAPLHQWIESRRILFGTLHPEQVVSLIESNGLGNRAVWQVLNGKPEPVPASVQFVEEALRQDQAKQEQIVCRVLQYYKENPPQKCHKILCIEFWEDCPGGDILDGIAAALVLHNLDVYRLVLPSSLASPHAIERRQYYPLVLSALDKIKPDLIFSVQYDIGYLLPPPVCKELQCPNVIYCVDYVVNEIGEGCEWRLFIASSSEILRSTNSFYRCSTYIPYGAISMPIINFPSAKYACPISFIGDCGMDKVLRKQKADQLRNAGMLDMAEDMIQQLLTGANLAELCRCDPVCNYSPEEKSVIRFYVLLESLRRRRLQYVEALLPFGIRVYGSNWKEISENPGFQKAACGPLPFRKRFSLYASSMINLNIHTPDRHNSPNTRFYEIPVARGFMITDWQQSYERFLSSEETVYYKDTESLVAKVNYYLHHPDAREPFIERAYTRMQSALTWNRWVEVFLQEIVPPYFRILNGSPERLPEEMNFP